MTAPTLTTTHHDARVTALDVLGQVEALLRPNMDAGLRIEAVTHLVSVRLRTANPAEGAQLAELLRLVAEKPVTTAAHLHHVWSGLVAGHAVRITVLVELRHFQTGSSTVRCGLAMRDLDHPSGWDLGTITVDPSAVTCPACLPRGRS
jgi:hypothetical protein